ncbi:hypothetical protein K1T71_006059 [Dendrolimus kikuchii]|uniref:Uncharacterized protein n=1 Tax=Dendrolimus kikuchii TaxID=765133 RepID=A0ACC1D339_9NEOP|nr:hypothetical protein K1T71_006059 [Dendrolimus kikuchii]
MAKWKLVRHTNRNEVYSFSEGEEITVGRGVNNAITLSSIVISRNHCVIKFQEDNATVTDLKSSNGTYIGTKKIPQCIPNVVNNLDIIGFGWTMEAPVININDDEKYVFQLVKEETKLSMIERLKFEDDTGNIGRRIKFNFRLKVPFKAAFLALGIDTLKRTTCSISSEEPNCKIKKTEPCDEIIEIPSEDENEDLSIVIKEEPQLSCKNQIKLENEYLEYEAFNVKQEYLGSNEECIEIDSESDSDSENWFLRLSQSSPGKPFIKKERKSVNKGQEVNNSYSQLDDFSDCIDFDENNLQDHSYNEDIMHDIISIPAQPPEIKDDKQEIIINGNKDFENELALPSVEMISTSAQINDESEANSEIHSNIDINNELTTPEIQGDVIKKAQMIEPLAQESRKKIKHKGKQKDSFISKKVDPQSKRNISESQKEERKRKLKDLATKDKEIECKTADSSSTTIHKSTAKVKVTATNRGAFLTDVQAIVKPMKRKESPKKLKAKVSERNEKVNNEKQNLRNNNENNFISEENTHKKTISKETINSNEKNEKLNQDSRLPLKCLKPLCDSEESISGKPFSKVDPLPPLETKKKVRFSEDGPKVHVFEIDPGNQMNKIRFVKKSLVDIRHRPVFSLEKLTLIKILRWNPHWLEEQINHTDPPPILGHNNKPMSILHSFVDHKQYIQLMGDLLLMEIWECLTVAYMKVRSKNHMLEMKIESLPPVPSHDRVFDLLNFSVMITSNETKLVPKVGEVIVVTFGPENASDQRFLYVHNVRCLPMRPGNKTVSYSVSLHAVFTEKMCLLKPGDVLRGKTLAYINKELTLFDAMEYLAISPLSDAILCPDSRHFTNKNMDIDIQSQWTNELNPSQKAAVKASVSAAQSDRPSIQMVQGPPGTGKSSVICAMVMAYFYNSSNKKNFKREKILICATSNAAVDELVLRLLNIRQKLPKEERFRMVRVGRTESMHPRAYDVSSQQLAQRDASRHGDAQAPGLAEEVSHLEAKINMWKTAAQDAKDPSRIAYCEGRIEDLERRMGLLRASSAPSTGHASLMAAERRIIEGADIVVTTLASAHNHKMRGLKGRIALCIIDEAGQAIEPETLIPLTLDVTKITLIGDPQQLPGFICSQRAKKHGLGESLFFRLTSCAERWPTYGPVVLLNEQYRMHPAIANYPNRAFYNGQIQTVAPARPKLNIPPYVIIGISSGDRGQGPSGANETEAWGVSRLVLALSKILRPLNLNMAVITPYNAHKDLIKKNIRNLQEPGSPSVEVNSVDGFQGQERDVVVVSVARSHGVGFLTDAGRMNVMLTRARHALLVCLNPNALLKNYQWRTLIEDAQKRKVYRDFPNRLCRPSSPGRPTGDDEIEDILKFLR